VRRRIVELGSGVSTVLLARLLHQRPPRDGFQLVAVEHDAGWAEWVTEQLDREGIGSGVSVVLAPLCRIHARSRACPGTTSPH
jgi:hypothetical protein